MRNLRLLYLGIELRALAALRIGLGSLLLFDLLKRCWDIRLWYTNAGLLPNHRVLWHPAPYQFSYLFSFFTLSQVRAAFVVIAAVYVCFLIGYRTRLFHVLSWLTLLSFHTRASFLANGGDYVFATLLLWTAFMPLGSRWSVDALRRSGETADSEPFVSLSVLALRCQLCVIYLFNALNKTGETWRDGSAVHYMLHQARIVTSLGIWAREHVPPAYLRLLSHGTVVIEYAIPLLILLPIARPWPRRLAIVLIWTLHINIAALANLGVFSPVMMVFALCLLGPDDFRWLASRERIRQFFERAAARVRALLSRLREPPARPALLPNTLRRVRELVVALLILCAVSQLIAENPALLGALEHRQPTFIRATIDYLRLNQGWSMFAPDAPRTDSWIVVDARTRSGKHVDPYNLRASDIADPNLRTVPARLGQDVFFCDYTARIADSGEFHDPLRDWILDHGARTRRPDETVLSFEAYVIEHKSPPLGQLQPTDTTVRVFLRGAQE